MILYIDTTTREELIVQLKDADTVIAERRYGEGYNHAQNLLPQVDALLKENDLEISDMEAIEVNPGPGSFTGTRVGVAVANALGFALGLPVNDKPAGEAMPVYDRAPNISIPKNAQQS